jgi:hypothetical protein
VAPALPVPAPLAKAPTMPERSLPGVALASRPQPQVRVNIYGFKKSIQSYSFFWSVIFISSFLL